MVKFNEVPKLNEAEKQFVVETLKPLLKQNKILEARAILNETYAVDRVHIIDFLLYHLQDAYFKDSDKIFDGEFYCSNMVHIGIPSNITDIYAAAFMECKQLEGVSIPDGVTEIAPGIFCGCRSLKNIVIPNGVTYISSEAFQETALKRVVVPKNCDIADNAFDKGVEIIRR